MGLDYLVMMIIHSPQPWVEVNQSENRYVEGNRVAWKALEDEYEAGKLKVIGGAVASTIFNRKSDSPFSQQKKVISQHSR